jgi:hypothetical protein
VLERDAQGAALASVRPCPSCLMES